MSKRKASPTYADPMRPSIGVSEKYHLSTMTKLAWRHSSPASRANIARLPAEIYDLIFASMDCDGDFIRRKSLANLRLTSKQMSSIATPCLFAEIPLWISMRSLENLAKISEHPSIAGFVRTIVFSPLSFNLPSPVDTQVMYSIINERSHTMNEQDLEMVRYELKYAACHEECTRLRKVATIIMTRAFRRLNALEGLHIASSDQWIGAREVKQRLPLSSGNEFTYSGQLTIPPVLQALQAAGKQLQKLEVSQDYQFYKEDQRLPFHRHESNTYNHERQSVQYSSLNLKNMLESDRLSIPAFLIIAEDSGRSTANPLSSVKELCLSNIKSSPREGQDGISAMYQAHQILLFRCQGLEQLTLRNIITGGLCRFERALHYSVLRQLEYIDLSHFKFQSVARFTKVFVANKHTLKRCFLEHVRGPEDTWPIVLSKLKHAKFTPTTFLLIDCCVRGHRTDVADWLAGRESEYKIVDDGSYDYLSDEESITFTDYEGDSESEEDDDNDEE